MPTARGKGREPNANNKPMLLPEEAIVTHANVIRVLAVQDVVDLGKVIRPRLQLCSLLPPTSRPRNQRCSSAFKFNILTALLATRRA